MQYCDVKNENKSCTIVFTMLKYLPTSVRFAEQVLRPKHSYISESKFITIILTI